MEATLRYQTARWAASEPPFAYRSDAYRRHRRLFEIFPGYASLETTIPPTTFVSIEALGGTREVEPNAPQSGEGQWQKRRKPILASLDWP